MKTKTLTSALLIAVLFACNKKSETSETETGSVPAEAAAPPVEIAGKECYQLASKMDTMKLSLIQNANNVNGELQIKLNEKDMNSGTVSGIFIGDTLFADYTFKSEGTTSVREIVFVKKGDALIQGSG
ncbi:MAG TPA: hypothetical protein VGB43_04030, partial [Flavobacterium sp.]